MTIDVRDQLSALGAHLDATVSDITVDEALNRHAEPRTARPTMRWAVAVGAVVLVLALLLPLLWLAGSGEPDVVATTIPPPVTTVATPPEESTLPTTITPPDAAPAPEGSRLEGPPSIVWEVVAAGEARVPFGNVVRTGSGFAVAEATVDRQAPDRDLLWTSSDGLSWASMDLPVEAALPLLVRTDDGYWLTSHGEEVRVWHTTSPSLVGWIPIDTSAVDHLAPFVTPYTDAGVIQPSIDLSGWSERRAWTSNGRVAVAQWLDDGFFGSLVVSDGLAPLAEVAAPWGRVPAYIVSSDGTFYAYVSYGFEARPGDIWTSEDGVRWTRVSDDLPFKFDVRGEPAHYFEVVERNGVFLAQAGYFCGLGDLWVSFDGVDFVHVGATPDAGAACAGSLYATDFGFVLVTDGGADPPRPNIWTSVDGIGWRQLDLSGLDMTGGNGETARSQLEITVERDAMFVHAYLNGPGPMWVGRPAIVVEIGDGSCAATPLHDESVWEYRLSLSSPALLELRNLTTTGSALILAGYGDGFGRDDLVAYGRDISTRPPFVEDAEIFEVPSGATRMVAFDAAPGRYAAICMDTTATMIVLEDLVIER